MNIFSLPVTECPISVLLLLYVAFKVHRSHVMTSRLTLLSVLYLAFHLTVEHRYSSYCLVMFLMGACIGAPTSSTAEINNKSVDHSL